MNFVSNLFAFL